MPLLVLLQYYCMSKSDGLKGVNLNYEGSKLEVFPESGPFFRNPLYNLSDPELPSRNFSVRVHRSLPRTIRASYIIYSMMKTKKDDGTFHKKFSIDELQLGFKFYADMLSRLCFFVICFIMILTFFCTFVQSWIRYNMQ